MKFLILLFIMQIIISKNVPAEGATIGTEQYSCINPNNRTGVCISLYACPTILKLYLNPNLETPENRDFIQTSYCSNGFGASPFVCCSADIRLDGKLNKTAKLIDNSLLTNTTDYIGNNNSSIENSLLASTTECFGYINSTYRYGRKGGSADILDFHWIAILEYTINSGKTHISGCLGSLINHRYILTSAYCIDFGDNDIKLDRVALGEYDLATEIDCIHGNCLDPVIYIGIDNTYKHELFNIETRINDIALIRLSENVLYNENIAPICLPLATGFNGSSIEDGAILSGWQSYNLFPDRNFKTNATMKLFLNLNITERPKCVQYSNNNLWNLTDEQLCVVGEPGEDLCLGAPGGPLMTTYYGMWTLEGIGSFGFGECRNYNIPRIYTRVSKYGNWIIRNLEE